MQFLFAADRGNMRVSERFDSLNPAGLKALKWIVEAREDAMACRSTSAAKWRASRSKP